MTPLKYVQLAISLGFIACIVLYGYLMVMRTRKKKDVDMQIWIVIGVGLLLSMATQYLGVVQGTTAWNKVQINLMVSAALVLFSGWMIYKKLKGESPQPPQTNKKSPTQVGNIRKKGKSKKK